MTNSDKLFNILAEKMMEQGLDEDIRYMERFQYEWEDLVAVNMDEYFLDLYERGVKFPANENNVVTPWLLGIVPDYDVEKPPKFFYGDFPDIDSDINPVILKYLKEDYIPRTFGRQNVCAISNYNTFGIRSALIDMARVFGADRGDILNVTTNLEAKDDEGKLLTWDKALKINKELKEYCESHPELADAAKRLVGRNRSRGKHAGGVIISRIPLDDFAPLVVDSDGNPACAWTEGLHASDLQPVGLVKYDFLGLKTLVQIALCVKLIKERHPEVAVKGVSALLGMDDFTDISYLNDPYALALANEGKLKGIFQFDSDGIRGMVKAGGVSRFEDLVVYNALYRPGPLNCLMHMAYIHRKKGEESYEIHPKLQSALGTTYGVMAFQEDVMNVLHIVGEIPLKDCYQLIKAISKKKEKEFAKYKQMFLDNGQRVLGWSLDKITEFWEQISAFAEYGFNKSVDEHTILYTTHGYKEIQDIVLGDCVYGVDEYGRTIETEVIALHDHGEIDGYEVFFDDGYSVVCSIQHKFLTKDGQVPLWTIISNRLSILCDETITAEDYAQEESEWLDSEMREDICQSTQVALPCKSLSSMQGVTNEREIRKLQTFGEMWCQDFNCTETKRTLSAMSKMQGLGLEEVERNTPVEVRSRVQNMAVAGGTPASVREMQGNQKGEYYNKEYEAQLFANTTISFVQSRTADIGTSRDSKSEGRTIETVEGGKSRKVRCNCSCLTTQSKTFDVANGEMDAVQVGLELFSNSLRGRAETSRFCSRQYLDRSRRVLSFLRMQEMEKTISVIDDTDTRQDVEFRGDFKGQCDADTSQHGMLCSFNWSNENGLVGDIPKYAQVSDIRRLVSREIIQVVSVGKRHMYDIEVACPTHNFLLPNGIVTSNSHSTSYAYNACRQLYLKAHFPLEFFATLLSTEDDTDSIKDYKLEATKFYLEVMPVEMNKSRVSFDVVDDKIYAGFSNIKGIGREVAERIVAGCPYASFEDFLQRFGTDASVLKPICGLRLFKDAEPVILFEFAEHYKDQMKKRIDRDKRSVASREKLKDELRYLMPEEYKDDDSLDGFFASTEGMDERDFRGRLIGTDGTELMPGLDLGAAWNVVKKYWRNVRSLEDKQKEDQPILLADFRPKFNIAAELKEMFTADAEVAQEVYYGYCWTHLLERSPDFKGGGTFDNLYQQIENGATGALRAEVHVVAKPKEVKFRSGKGSLFSVKMQDAKGRVEDVKFWKDDFERFREELEFWESDHRKGNLLHIHLRAPDPGFKGFTFFSPPRHMRHKEVPKSKGDDGRLVKMDRPQ